MISIIFFIFIAKSTVILILMSKLKGKIMKVYRPIPINEEIKLNHKKIIVSKTDKKGNILYVNDYFCEVTGYEPNDVIGLPHNIIRHQICQEQFSI